MKADAKRGIRLAIEPALKRTLRNTFRALRLRMQRYHAPSLDWASFFEQIKGLGFRPDTTIDVGVAWGTEELYDAFPDASYILVEPLREFEPALNALSARLDAQIISAAAGATPGKMMMHVEALPSNSSAFPKLVDNEIASYEVDVVRLDQAIKLGPGKALLKVDVQGAELQVMEGCSGLLDRIDMAILETSLIAQEEGIPEFGDVVGYMKENGFVVYGIIGGAKRPLDHALAQIDLVFVPERHALRADRRWSAPIV